jgi:hypothetical protein
VDLLAQRPTAQRHDEGGCGAANMEQPALKRLLVGV